MPLDLVLLTLLLGAAGYLVFRITTKLDYNWNWTAIPQYLFRYDEESGRWVSNYLIHGLLTTLRLSLWASLLALPAGLFMALARTSRSLFWRLVSRSYIELMRNLPPLVIIFIFYFFLADQFIPILDIDARVEQASEELRILLTFFFDKPSTLSAFISALITLALFESAYMAEIFRAGIESIEKHQWEGAYAIGMSRYHTMRHIILPQAARRVLPPLGGQLISLIKDSAIVSVIAIQELTYQGTQLMASTYLTIEVWITIACMYLLLTFPCSLGVRKLEKLLNRQ